jgi:glucose-1-phosphate cytidylyltransferase
MKIVILAGGKGSRLVEETGTKSKAMVRIGDDPILWHIMKYYASFGLSHFVVALGYQADSIRSYFEAISAGPVIRDGPRMVVHPKTEPGWTVELIDTGLETLSGGRIKRLAPYLGSEPFMLTYCDGLADVDLDKLLAFHFEHGRLATLTAIHPQPRFGRLSLEGGRIVAFQEKVINPDEWVNGGFFVLNPEVLEYIAGDATQWEREPLADLAADGELMAYRHKSFWQCMDTLPESILLNDLWRRGVAPWKRWVLAMIGCGMACRQVIWSTLDSMPFC